jgi:pre-mRNA-splicing factor SYF2/beta-D-xylosidase 4
MAFNRTLWYATGNQIGREARAMMNAGNGMSTFWAPVINLAREPRWGRNIETREWTAHSSCGFRPKKQCAHVLTEAACAAGEDPYLTGEYATYYSQGMQTAPEDPYHIQVSPSPPPHARPRAPLFRGGMIQVKIECSACGAGRR